MRAEDQIIEDRVKVLRRVCVDRYLPSASDPVVRTVSSFDYNVLESVDLLRGEGPVLLADAAFEVAGPLVDEFLLEALATDLGEFECLEGHDILFDEHLVKQGSGDVDIGTRGEHLVEAEAYQDQNVRERKTESEPRAFLDKRR